MKLKKLLAIEVFLTIAIVLAILITVGLIPYFEPSAADTHIGPYNEQVFSKGSLSISKAQTVNIQFNYSSYDPPILVLDLSFLSCQNSGNLSIYANNRLLANLYVNSENKNTILNTVSFSGIDWVEPRTVDSYTFGNQISFISQPQNGFEGNFDYQVSIRGSR